MKSCINWRKSFKYMDQIDEFNIIYRKGKAERLIGFLGKYANSDCRVNIQLSEIEIADFDDTISLLIEIYKRDQFNVAIVLDRKVTPDFFINELKEAGLKFYYSNLVFSWDTLLAFIEEGVSDVFISGDLAFDLERVKFIIRDKVQIRCYADICQSDYKGNQNGFKNFFIRPEDVDIYDEYVDIIEFYQHEERQNTLYEIYFKDKEWNGNLQEIIQGLQLKINNYYILGTEFANRRKKCRRKCIKGESCKLCDRLQELADTLEDSNEYEVFKRR